MHEVIHVHSLLILCMAESDSDPLGNTHAAGGANQKASNVGQGKGGPGVVKMEGVYLYVWS